MTRRRFVFNLPSPGIADDEYTYLYSDEPALMLEEAEEAVPRHGRQSDRIPGPLPGDDSLFGARADWAFRAYRLHRLALEDEREDPATQPEGALPIGNAPPRPTSRPRLRQAIQRLGDLSRKGYDLSRGEPLYLFNVIVALEWVPTAERLRRLEFTFRRAAETLYDVTNGTMSFGQVILADSDWMGCADIQVFASNRLLPRSWVGGLVLPEKYVPIRLGRGIWYNSRQLALEWDEPEGYRTIVHEWLHYALGLKDEYLKPFPARRTASGQLIGVQTGEETELDPIVVLPRRRVKSDSIMATAEGSSELESPLTPGASVIKDLVGQWYPLLKGSRLEGRFAGPGRLPLPLPVFRRAGRLQKPRGEERRVFMPLLSAKEHRLVSEAHPDLPAIPLDRDGIPPARWMVYVVHPSLDRPERLIAQGEIDARALEQGFAVLGGAEGDTLLLVSPSSGQVWVRELHDNTGVEAQLGSSTLITDRPATAEATRPEVDPVARFITQHGGWRQVADSGRQQRGQSGSGGRITVVPEQLAAGADPTMPRLRLLNSAGEGYVRIFPLGEQPVEAAPGDVIPLNSLDGVVLDLRGGQLRVGDFSQGGGPRSSPNVNTNPIAAGAASGDALLFFHTEDQGRDYSHVRVVTNTLREEVPDSIVALSPVFALAANDWLDPALHPTLMIFNTVDSGSDDASLRIYRLDASTGQAHALPTFIAAGATSAAAPLADAAAGGSLVTVEVGAGPRLERYVLGRPAPDGAAVQ